METRNLYTTVDSQKVGSKCLEDEGAAKKPPPHLRIIKCIYNKHLQYCIPFCHCCWHLRHDTGMGMGSRSLYPSNTVPVSMVLCVCTSMLVPAFWSGE